MAMKFLTVVFGILFMATGCYDIFEEDISEKEMMLIAPADSVKTFHQTLTFAWEPLEGASGYRLVVVSPSFEKAELFVLDSLVPISDFTLKLAPGEYEWKVRPENSAYQGVFKTRQFTILDTVTDH